MLDRCFMRLLLVCPAVCHSYICAWEKNNKLTQHKKTSFYSNTHIFAKLDPTFCFCCQICTFDTKTSDVFSSHISCSSHSDLHTQKLTIHKLSSSLRLNASVYTSQTQVCTQSSAALLCPHSSLRNQDRHSGVNDAVPSTPSPTSWLLPFTIHKHHSSAGCLMWKLRPHFLSTWEIFGPNPWAAWPRCVCVSRGFTPPHLCPAL